MCGATTRPAPARVEPVAASEKTAIARRRRTQSKDTARDCVRMVSGVGRALAANSHDGGMGQVGAEALLAAQAPPERLERAQGDLLLRTAATAHQMAVPLDVGTMPA